VISSDFIHVSAQISGGLTHVVSFPNIKKPWIPSTAPCLGRPRRWPAARSWPLSASAAAYKRLPKLPQNPWRGDEMKQFNNGKSW